jgi:hypothetical protein
MVSPWVVLAFRRTSVAAAVAATCAAGERLRAQVRALTRLLFARLMIHESRQVVGTTGQREYIPTLEGLSGVDIPDLDTLSRDPAYVLFNADYGRAARRERVVFTTIRSINPAIEVFARTRNKAAEHSAHSAALSWAVSWSRCQRAS